MNGEWRAQPGEEEAVALIVVSVCTDHHPFDRLIDWLQAWVLENPEVDVVVQHGTSPEVTGAVCRTMLPHPELMELFRTADACVLQGGPGGVMDARSQGLRPIVVPRDPTFGEHVDGHQIAFSHHLAERGLAQVVTTETDLLELLDATVADRLSWRFPPDLLPAEGVERITELPRTPPPAATHRWRGWRHVWGRSDR